MSVMVALRQTDVSHGGTPLTIWHSWLHSYMPLHDYLSPPHDCMDYLPPHDYMDYLPPHDCMDYLPSHDCMDYMQLHDTWTTCNLMTPCPLPPYPSTTIAHPPARPVTPQLYAPA